MRPFNSKCQTNTEYHKRYIFAQTHTNFPECIKKSQCKIKKISILNVSTLRGITISLLCPFLVVLTSASFEIGAVIQDLQIR